MLFRSNPKSVTIKPGFDPPPLEPIKAPSSLPPTNTMPIQPKTVGAPPQNPPVAVQKKEINENKDSKVSVEKKQSDSSKNTHEDVPLKKYEDVPLKRYEDVPTKK